MADKRKLGLYISIATIVLLQLWWVDITVRWVNITWFLFGVYALTGISIALVLHTSGRLARYIIIAATTTLSGPISLILGEYGRRNAWSGVFDFAMSNPIQFAANAYSGELLSGAVLIHVVIPLLALRAVNASPRRRRAL